MQEAGGAGQKTSPVGQGGESHQRQLERRLQS